MASSRTTRIAAAITAYLPLITMMIIGESVARELRPSDHGLEYQSVPPTGLKSPEMMSFFGAESKSSSSSTPSTVALPKAMNSNETSWWAGGSSRRGSDHLRHVLLLGSLVCGVTGVALLAASAFIYLIKRSSPSTNNNNNNNTNNSLVLIGSK
ncbi:hypothetical protein QQP08_020258 [Theobroma cacao]|uniref:Transmembrane protein n=1 Tax=Theobroma cacao TaxID=3641 RepID=A0A061G7V3_THECC|nr:Uncharacterized protein TCM_026915 [Theobroma cacao]WRX27771.1 hypothetical protein QQP08_020258 [Theobroma cacao]